MPLYVSEMQVWGADWQSYTSLTARQHVQSQQADTTCCQCLQELSKLGGVSDPLMERLWNIIQHLAPGSSTNGSEAAAAGSSKPQVAPRPGAAIPGLALQNTRNYAKQLDEELVQEATTKPGEAAADKVQQEQAANAAGPSGHGAHDGSRSRHGSDRDRREDGRSRGERSRDGDVDRHRDMDWNSKDSSRHRGPSRDRDGYVDGEADRGRHRSGKQYDSDHRRRSRSRDADGRHRRRSRSPSGSRDHKRARSDNSSPVRRPAQPPVGLAAPELGAVYRGKVSGIMEFGCFVELMGFRKKVEGLVHVSNISAARVGSAKDVVQRGQDVWVKCISVSGARVGLSIRDVDQQTGQDLLNLSKGGDAANGGAPVRSALQGISGIKANPLDFEETNRRRAKKLTEAELWEYKQLAMSGVLDIRELPTFDEEGGLGVLAGADDDAEEEFEIDLNDDEPEFLKGHSTKSGIEMSPIKIVKNPEGSMQRAAMTQVGQSSSTEFGSIAPAYLADVVCSATVIVFIGICRVVHVPAAVGHNRWWLAAWILSIICSFCIRCT